MLENAGCLRIKDRARILGWKLVNEGRGMSEAKQLCWRAGRIPKGEIEFEA